MTYDNELERAIVFIARDRTLSQPWLEEDAAQEGRIAAWEALQHRPGDTGYAVGAARNAIKDIAMGARRMTGSAHQGVKPPLYETVESLDDYAASYSDVEAELAYHRAEIAAVVSALSTRQQAVVYAVAFDQPMNSSQRGEWSGRLRPRLAGQLGHLKELL